MTHMTKNSAVTTAKGCHNFPWFYWSHALFSPTTDRSKDTPSVSREWYPSQSEECRNSTPPHHIQILYSASSATSFCQISLKSILLFLHTLISSTKPSPFSSCQVQQCSPHWIFPVADLTHLPLPPCPFSKLCFFSQYQLWCLSFTGVNTEAKANFVLRQSNICRLHISSHPAIHLQTICANTLFQIHAAVVTYGESAATPADVHSELPQHELQTAWRNCSVNSFRPRTTDWKNVAIKCKHWINMWMLLFFAEEKTEGKLGINSAL